MANQPMTSPSEFSDAPPLSSPSLAARLCRWALLTLLLAITVGLPVVADDFTPYYFSLPSSLLLACLTLLFVAFSSLANEELRGCCARMTRRRAKVVLSASFLPPFLMTASGFYSLGLFFPSSRLTALVIPIFLVVPVAAWLLAFGRLSLPASACEEGLVSSGGGFVRNWIAALLSLTCLGLFHPYYVSQDPLGRILQSAAIIFVGVAMFIQWRCVCDLAPSVLRRLIRPHGNVLCGNLTLLAFLAAMVVIVANAFASTSSSGLFRKYESPASYIRFQMLLAAIVLPLLAAAGHRLRSIQASGPSKALLTVGFILPTIYPLLVFYFHRIENDLYLGSSYLRESGWSSFSRVAGSLTALAFAVAAAQLTRLVLAKRANRDGSSVAR
jgi:hypothetical protein